MRLDILTPAGSYYSGEVRSVTLPGSEGPFQVLIGHAPIISELEGGDVVIRERGGRESLFNISGGVAEVKVNKITVLADSVQKRF